MDHGAEILAALSAAIAASVTVVGAVAGVGVAAGVGAAAGVAATVSWMISKRKESKLKETLEKEKNQKKEEIVEHIGELLDTDGFFRSIIIPPGLMRRGVENKAEELLADFGSRVDGNGREKEKHTQELENWMQSKVDPFCHNYLKKYRRNLLKLLLISAFVGGGIGVKFPSAFPEVLTREVGLFLTRVFGCDLTGAVGPVLTGVCLGAGAVYGVLLLVQYFTWSDVEFLDRVIEGLFDLLLSQCNLQQIIPGFRKFIISENIMSGNST